MSKWERRNSYSCGSITVDGQNLADGIRLGDCVAIGEYRRLANAVKERP